MSRLTIQMARKEASETWKEKFKYNNSNPWMNMRFVRVKIYNEVEYMDNVIEERQENIDKINKIMNNIRDIAVDFNTEVQSQGVKLGKHQIRIAQILIFSFSSLTEELNHNMDDAKLNTKKANDQLRTADNRHRRSGKMLCCIALIILVVCAIIIGILFGTNIIG